MTTSLRVNRIDLTGSVADGPGLRTVVFLQGCDRAVKCVHCHNPSSHSMRGGTAMSVDAVVAELKKSPIRRVTLSGGEPLAQKDGLVALLDALRADQRQFPDAVWPKKGYYTNSFHVAVDSGVSIARKLQVEGPLHEFATGGSISYVELREAPLANVEAIRDIIDIATACGVSYLGVNYPLDICQDCHHRGTFDSCPKCGSKAIRRIRRVSGYLETLDEFATGKRAEESHRVANG